MAFTNEGNHALEFLLSEANGYRSRENGTLKSGETTAPGSILVWDGAELIVSTGALTSAGALDESIAGVAGYAVDASAAAQPIMYIARDAEVSSDRLDYPDESSAGGEQAAVIAALGTLGIRVRTGNTVPSP